MEAFATAAAALSLAGLFNSCVECFDYIQLSRSFGRDFQTQQLRLDIAKVRLTRWGQAMNINGDPRYSQDATESDETIALAKSLVGHILFLFVDADKASSRLNTSPADLVRFDAHCDLTGSPKALHERMHSLAQRRQKRSSLLTKVSWALYRGRHLDTLVADIHECIDRLIQLLPPSTAADTLPLLAAEEVEQFDVNDLPVLEEVAGGADELLQIAAVDKIEALAGGHRINDIKMTDNTDIKLGDQYRNTAIERNFRPPSSTGHFVGKVDGSGRSRLQVGNLYGESSTQNS